MLVVAPHQLSHQPKTSPQPFFTSPIEISQYGTMPYTSSNNRAMEVTNSSSRSNSTVIDDNVTEDNNHKIPTDIDCINEKDRFKDATMATKRIIPKEGNDAKSLMQQSTSMGFTDDKENIKCTEKLTLQNESTPTIQLLSLHSKKDEKEWLHGDENLQSIEETTELFGCVAVDNEIPKNSKNEISLTTQSEDNQFKSTEADRVRQSKQIKEKLSEGNEKVDIPSIVPLPKEKSLTKKTLNDGSKKDISTHKKKNTGSVFHSRTVATWLAWCVVLLCALCIVLYIMYGKNSFSSEKGCTSTGFRMNWEKGPPPT